MNINLISFITIVAWPLAVLSTLLIILRIIAFFTYRELDKLKDQCKGIYRSFPIAKPSLIALISWAWLFTN